VNDAKISLHGYDESDRRRIKNLACQFVAAMLERGDIEQTEDAVRKAMPQAIRDARDILGAVNEYLCG
jgi:hypothetical protein